MNGRDVPAIRTIAVPDLLRSVVWHPSGQLITGGGSTESAFEAGWLYTWEASSGKLVQALQAHTNSISCISISPDGSLLASAGYDHQVHIWAIPSHTRLHTLTGYRSRVHAVAFSPDERVLASGGNDAACVLWERATQRQVAMLKDTWDYSICSLAYTPDGQRLVCGHDGGIISVWAAATGHHVATLTDEFEWVLGRAISPDGTLLASGGEGEIVTVWHVDTLQPIVQLLGHRRWPGNAAGDNPIRTIAFHPYLPLLASGADDGTVQLWSTRSGEQLAILEHPSRVLSVAFSPDGTALVSACAAKTLTWWDLRALL